MADMERLKRRFAIYAEMKKKNPPKVDRTDPDYEQKIDEYIEQVNGDIEDQLAKEGLGPNRKS
jgi:hypothetical protein